VCEIHAVDAAAHYRQLLQLGRDEFLASAAPAALVRYHADSDDAASGGLATLTLDEEIEDTLPHGRTMAETVDFELFPLLKKPGAAFPDRITIGRTANNDVVIADTSVSRLHAYVRRANDGRWVVGLEGIVTAVDGAARTPYLFVESDAPDADAATSEGLRVEWARAKELVPGDRVRMHGRIVERSPGARQLTVTTLVADWDDAPLAFLERTTKVVVQRAPLSRDAP